MIEVKGTKKAILTKAARYGSEEYTVKELRYKDIPAPVLEHPSYLEAIDYTGKGVEYVGYYSLINKKSKKRYILVETPIKNVAFSKVRRNRR